MFKIFIALFLVIICLTSVRIENRWPEVYQVYFAVYKDDLKAEKKLILRKFIQEGKEYFLIVDPHTLNTGIIEASQKISPKDYMARGQSGV